jgi:hypothetical protein
VSCDTKIRYGHVGKAYAAIDNLGDPYLVAYVCQQHRCVHIGHKPFRRSYTTWASACQAVRDIHATQDVPRRMRIWSDAGRWHVEWTQRLGAVGEAYLRAVRGAS